MKKAKSECEEKSKSEKWPPDPSIDTLYDQVAPLRWILASLLLWPLQKMPDGRAGAPRKSLLMFITVSVFIGLTAINIDVMLLRLRILKDNAANFTDSVFYFIFLQLLTSHYCIPLVQWPEAPGIADYFNAWTQFQMDWRCSRLAPLCLNVRKRCFLMCCAGIAIPMTVVFTELFLAPDLSLYQCIAYAPTAEYFFITGCIWNIFAYCIKESSTQLAHQLNQAALEGRMDLETVREVARLWRRLDALAVQTTTVFMVSMMHYLLFALSIILTTFFGVLIAATHRVITKHTAGQLCLSLDNLLHMYIVHEIGHIASTHVSTDTRIVLLYLKLDTLPNQETCEEIMYFLSTMKRRSPALTLGGFCECSRSAFVQMFSGCATYMVVLLQFAFTVPETKESITV